MDPKISSAAQAFSGHDFEAAFDGLADDVQWDNVGGPRLSGKDAVIAACRDSAQELARVETVFHNTRVFEGDGHLVVDTLAEYTEPGGDSTTVGSCDVYEAAGGQITSITSYNVAVEPS